MAVEMNNSPQSDGADVLIRDTRYHLLPQFSNIILQLLQYQSSGDCKSRKLF